MSSVLLEVKQAACHRGVEKNMVMIRARRRARGGYLTLRAQKSLHPAGLPAADLYWIPSSCIHRAFSCGFRGARARARRRARGGYLTLRAQKSLHSAGLPAAPPYWIPSSCISEDSKLGRMNRGKIGDGAGLCVPRRSKSFCWLGCIRFCSTVVSPFPSDSKFLLLKQNL